jgi:exodeoxyribonuclease VII large subunit
MQFQVRTLQAAGEGALRLRVATLARRLEAEGLMSPERRRPLPEYPDRIALVTSPRGKAVHDVIRTLRRRYPVADLLVAGVAVEGTDASAHIVEGLRAAAASGADVIILARGGGSFEDLMPFNDEAVARAIVACTVPVVTGIGHEPDTSIADMVADLRASTPTAAAEAVAPSAEDVRAALEAQGRLLARALQGSLRAAERRIAVLRSHAVFRDPRALTAVAAQRVDTAASGLPRALPGRIERDRVWIETARERLETGAMRSLERAGAVLRLEASRLEDLSPLGILARGYAVCYSEAGSVVRASSSLEAGDHVLVRLQRGSAGCLVQSVSNEGISADA